MAENKTKPNETSVQTFLAGVEDDAKRADCLTLLKLMQEATGQPPQMWGDAIIGFGSYHYKYASGREGDSLTVGFSPRKQNITLYGLAGGDDYEALLGKLGKHKTGKGCLYIKSLKDVDTAVLTEIIHHGYASK